MSDPVPTLPPGESRTLHTLIELLPEPCAIVAATGVLSAVNGAWRDIFVVTGVGQDLIEACAALFTWDAQDWAVVQGDLEALRSGMSMRCQFEALIAEPPERWASSTLVLSDPLGGELIWQLREVTEWRLAEVESTRVWQQIRDAIESISDGFALYDSQDRLVFCNQRYRELFADSADVIVPGRSFAEILRRGAERDFYIAARGRIEEWVSERLHWRATLQPTEQEVRGGRWLRIVDRRTADGGCVAICTDLTEQKRSEELRRQSEEQGTLIRAQAQLLAELSTPLLRISDRLVVMPLVGALDSARASQVVETLLHAVEDQRVEVAIMDITGVPIVDTQIANLLLQCARAVQLLGSQMVLTGIRPDVAQTMIALGIDLGNVVTYADLQAGIRHALSRK